MLQRKYLFPHVIEMNYQAGRRLGVNVYLIDGGSEFLLIDIGYEDGVDEIVDLIRQMDFNLSRCKMVIATHADADHIQGIATARELLKTKVAAHPTCVEPLETGDGDDLRPHQGPGHRHPDAALQDRPAAQRGRHDRGRRREPEGLAHAGPHAGAALLQDGQPALQRRQHLQGQLRRRHRRPPRLEHAGLRQVARAHPGRRLRVLAAQPRPGLPPRQSRRSRKRSTG